jgi:4-amino-4-deoxy-L-arabinose transferase-like glycosyltransferase
MRPRRSALSTLGLLLTAVAINGAAWALLNPPWQAPDEPAHFGYTQLLAERFELPGTGPAHEYSREQRLAVDAANGDQTAAQLATKPQWDPRSFQRWKRAQARLPDSARGDGGGASGGVANPARTNPPLYYLYESIPYLAATAGDLYDRLFVMRLWSVALLLVTVGAAWMLVGEVFGCNQLLQLTGAAVVGLQPMATFVTATVNPDALLMASWAVALWLGARILRRGLTFGSAAGLGAAVAVAALTKATGYALIPGALLVLGTGAWRLRADRLGSMVAPAVAVFVLAAPVAAWLSVAGVLDRPAVNQVAGGTSTSGVNLLEFGSYLWQFYLPKLPFQTPFPVLSSLPVFDIWIKTGWGAFGWLEVRLPDAVYVLLALMTVALIGFGIAGLLRRRSGGGLVLLAFFGLAVLGLLLGLHWAEYRVITQQSLSFNQGRYLLPLLPLLGVGAAGLLEFVGPRARGQVAGALLGGFVVLQLFSLAIVAGRFYA